MKAEFEDPEKLKVLLSAEPTSELVADIGQVTGRASCNPDS